jgi:hypothetical protein
LPVSSFQLPAEGIERFSLLGAGSWELGALEYQLRVLEDHMVKLLRAYGECLGARSR